MRCYFTEKLVRDALGRLGGRTQEEVRIESRWNPQCRLAHGGSYPHLLDWPSGHRRLATRQDVIDMARMAHVLDEFDCVGNVLTCSDVDQRIEPLWAALELAQITDKRIGGGEIFYADYIEPLVRMGEVISGKPAVGYTDCKRLGFEAAFSKCSER
jgi:trimethylamine:corrinoid methyltransferase-like protein